MGRLRNGVGIGISNIPTLSSRRAFSPLSLFADGSQGVWYDDSLTSSMYQESTGVTPAALESPVGLQLDLSRSPTLGAEANSDTNFASLSGWTSQAGTSISGGKYILTACISGNSTFRTSAITLTAGTLYAITFTIDSISSGALQAFVGGPAGCGFSKNAAGTYTVYGCADGSGQVIALRAVGTTTAQVSYFSIVALTSNHRYQLTAVNRPTLSARYNLLTKTEQFDNAAWSKSLAVITADATTAPDGTVTADLYTANSGVAQTLYLYNATGTSIVSGSSYTISVSLKQGTQRYIQLSLGALGGQINSGIVIDTNTMTIVATGSGTSATYTSSSVTAQANGFYRFSVTGSNTAVTSYLALCCTDVPVYATTPLATGGNNYYVWGADLRPANQATGLIPTYQRVDTSSVYDTVGFPQYIKYDGLNSSLSTASINFTATAQMAVFVGVRKFNTASGMINELSSNSVSTNGSFSLSTGNIQTGLTYAGYSPVSRGTALALYSSQTAFTAPITNTLNQRIDLTQTTLFATNGLYVNATAVTPQSTVFTASTGNFSTNPLYFGARAGTSVFFNGYEFQTIIVGKTLTATEITNTETYVNSKTLAY